MGNKVHSHHPLLITKQVQVPAQLKRYAITIVYNGLHHLKHKGFCDFMAVNFDHWVVVEGHSKPGGSTSHCNKIQVPPVSEDGTVAFMSEFAKKHDNVTFKSFGKYFRSKDDQVNMAVTLLKRQGNYGFLWQVDVDEHWTSEGLEKAEQILLLNRKRQAMFRFNHFVGPGLIAVGDWGSGNMSRLFLWRGAKFTRHEPPTMHPRSRIMEIEDVRYDHYSYCFAEDVKFKEKYYPGCDGMFSRWDSLQKETEFPQPITRLFSPSSPIGKSNSTIIRHETK